MKTQKYRTLDRCLCIATVIAFGVMVFTESLLPGIVGIALAAAGAAISDKVQSINDKA